MADLILLPRPRRVERGAGTAPHREPTVRVDERLRPQGYRLRVTSEATEIDAADDAGVFYAHATLEQLRRQGLPVVTIEDHPDLAVRGVMLDVSRDKVPTLDTLRSIVDRLAGLKYNQLQLYIEHTFAHAGHDAVWADADPYTCDEMRELDGYCRTRHVELVPNRNSLGHMERWLRHDGYRPMAVTQDPTVEVFGRRIPTPTLDPRHPGTLPFVGGLLEEIAGCFSSGLLHVGLDEPFGLPDERIAEWSDHLRALRTLPALDGRELLVWADVLSNHPELIEDVPAGVTICEWGYESWHPFAQNVRRFRDAGLPVWACPGTSSWMSLAGRWTNARDNIAGAVDAHPDGFLLTDWGDMGHLQYLPVSEPMFAWGAAMSWCADTNRRVDLERACDVHVFEDPAGQTTGAVRRLGDLYQLVTPKVPNASVLALPLYFPGVVFGAGMVTGITETELASVDAGIADAIVALGRARPRRADGDLLRDELRMTADLLAHLVADARARLRHSGNLESIPDDERAALAGALRSFPDRHAALWRARNREGGLRDSLSRFDKLLARYQQPQRRT